MDDLPRISHGVDGGGDVRVGEDSARPSPRAGILDLSFGQQGETRIQMPFPVHSASVIADGDELLLLASTGEASLVRIRCSRDGVCDTAHALELFKRQGAQVNAIAMRDPRGKGLLVYSWAFVQVADVADLMRVTHEGGVETLLHEEPSEIDRNSDRLMLAGPGRIVRLDSFQEADGGHRLNLRAILEDGGRDSHFGTNGLVSFVPERPISRMGGAVADGDGRIVVGLRGDFLAFFLRFHADGGIDPTFQSSSQNIATTTETLIADDGGYLVGGNRNDALGLVLRLAGDGRLDPSYWDGGVFRFPPFSSSDLSVVSVSNMEYAPDGRILVLGTARRPSGVNTVVLARIGPGGLDTDFGQNGLTQVAVDTSAQPGSLAIQSDGKAVVIWTDNAGDIRLVRYRVE